ncbi:BTAD domain-containing putative transcriptional regulator [Streptomyces sp. NPDC002870]|uniref:BTAD domain-containing putative transcriptional regulator n=1 Tax=Streptomyces sp. NPDC002870 TaxID=3364666 RepID=UPI0036C543EF
MEVQVGGRPVALGGFKQRTALGLLLLRANRVVATSEMLGALWPEENRPATARKIVQNAVWSLRAMFSEASNNRGPATIECPELLTQAPGYMLRINPDRLDANRFDRRVAEGRAGMAMGEPERAAALLRDALGEWRGPALADLAEHGVDWPELTALRQLRLDVMEDRFEAELLCGRHHTVLGELVSLAEEEPLRERLSGQLMLALYRCGRQAEALSVFSRVRRALVEEYGLEPSRDLQTLQQNILNHDVALAPPARPAVDEEPVLAAVRPLRPEPRPQPPLAQRPATKAVDGSGTARPADRPTTERRTVSVLLVRTGFTGESAAFGPGLENALHEAVTAVAQAVEEFGGRLVGSLGYLSVALFGLPEDDSVASVGAVRAALAVRERLRGSQGPAFQAVVTEGTALVRHHPHDPTAPVSVVGRLLDDAQALLHVVPTGEVYVSGAATRATEVWVRHQRLQQPDGVGDVRRVCGLRAAGDGPGVLRDAPVDREYELAVLTGLLDRARRHDAPHLITILGEPHVGKSRLVAQFEARVAQQSPQVRVVRAPGEDTGPAGTLRIARDMLAACCRLPEAAADARLTQVVRRLAGQGTTAERLLRCLRPLLGLAVQERDLTQVLAGWREMMVLLARKQPLVLCFDDVHMADEEMLDCIEKLASSAQDAPLLVVVCARPELLERHPFWGSGQRHAGTLTLDRLPDAGSALPHLAGWPVLTAPWGGAKPACTAPGTALGTGTAWS